MVAWHPSDPVLFSASYDDTVKVGCVTLPCALTH